MLLTTHFFVNNFWKREFVSKKVSFSTRLYKRGAFSHFLIRDCKANPKIIVVGKWTHLPTYLIVRPHNKLDWNV